MDSGIAEWIRCGPDEWCTPESSGRLLVRRAADYHELVGGDFYFRIPLEFFLVLEWGAANTEALCVCDTLDEAKLALLKLSRPNEP